MSDRFGQRRKLCIGLVSLDRTEVQSSITGFTGRLNSHALSVIVNKRLSNVSWKFGCYRPDIRLTDAGANRANKTSMYRLRRNHTYNSRLRFRRHHFRVLSTHPGRAASAEADGRSGPALLIAVQAVHRGTLSLRVSGGGGGPPGRRGMRQCARPDELSNLSGHAEPQRYVTAESAMANSRSWRASGPIGSSGFHGRTAARMARRH